MYEVQYKNCEKCYVSKIRRNIELSYEGHIVDAKNQKDNLIPITIHN